MNINDFRFMRKGKQMQLLTPTDAHLLQPIDRRSTLKNRALLLLHGFTSTPGVYREMLPLLSMYAAIVCPALPGHADSIVSFNNVKAAEWVTASEQVCQSLIQEYQAVDVLGLSLGGAAWMSSQYPFQSKSFVLIGTSASTSNKYTSIALVRPNFERNGH